MKKLFMLYLGVALMLLSCQKKESLYVYNWSYFLPEEVIKRFEQEYGVSVVLETYSGNEEMYAKLVARNGIGYDLVFPSGDYVSLMKNKGMLAPLNHSLLPNMKNVDSQVMSFTDFDPEHIFSVPYFIGSTGIHINTEEVADYDESWTLFENSKYRNYMSLMDDPRDVLGGALKTLGYSGNTTNAAEIEQAKNLILEKWKPNLLKIDSESFGKDFASKNTWIAQGYAEIILKEIEGETSHHRFFIPREGTMITMDNMVILEKAKNKELAHKFINFLLQPEVHALIADTYYYPVIIPAAETYKTKVAPYTVQDLFSHGSEFRKDLGEYNSLYITAWESIKAGY